MFEKQNKLVLATSKSRFFFLIYKHFDYMISEINSFGNVNRNRIHTNSLHREVMKERIQ